jgi:hypothetical protein
MHLAFLQRIYALDVDDAYKVKRVIPVYLLRATDSREMTWPLFLVDCNPVKSQKLKKKLLFIKSSMVFLPERIWKQR